MRSPITLEIERLRDELAKPKVLAKELYNFVHSNQEPLLNTFNKFAETPEFKKCKERLGRKREAKSRAEAEESFNKMKDEIMKKEKSLGGRKGKEED